MGWQEPATPFFCAASLAQVGVPPEVRGGQAGQQPVHVARLLAGCFWLAGAGALHARAGWSAGADRCAREPGALVERETRRSPERQVQSAAGPHVRATPTCCSAAPMRTEPVVGPPSCALQQPQPPLRLRTVFLLSALLPPRSCHHVSRFTPELCTASSRAPRPGPYDEAAPAAAPPPGRTPEAPDDRGGPAAGSPAARGRPPPPPADHQAGASRATAGTNHPQQAESRERSRPCRA